MKHVITRPDIVVLSPWYRPAMDELDAHFTVHKLWEVGDRHALLESLRESCVGIAGSKVCDAATMDALPKTRVIAHCGVGYDGVDVAAATARGIKVSNTPDVLSDEVADFALGLTLATLRRIPQGDRYVREGRWEREGDMAFAQRVWGRSVGILGLGRIGMEIARRCEAFKMSIAYHSRYARDVPYRYYPSLVDMARDVDILIAIVPGGAATRHLVGREVLDALGPAGVLINVARGSVDRNENSLVLDNIPKRRQVDRSVFVSGRYSDGLLTGQIGPTFRAAERHECACSRLITHWTLTCASL